MGLCSMARLDWGGPDLAAWGEQCLRCVDDSICVADIVSEVARKCGPRSRPATGPSIKMPQAGIAYQSLGEVSSAFLEPLRRGHRRALGLTAPGHRALRGGAGPGIEVADVIPARPRASARGVAQPRRPLLRPVGPHALDVENDVENEFAGFDRNSAGLGHCGRDRQQWVALRPSIPEIDP